METEPIRSVEESEANTLLTEACDSLKASLQQTALRNIERIADLSNEDLQRLELRFSYLHDRMVLVGKAFVLELGERRKDGRMPRAPNPAEGMFAGLEEAMKEAMEEHNRRVHRTDDDILGATKVDG